MREFDIWMEGFVATGCSGRASKIGTGLGDTFDDAVKDYINRTPNSGVKENSVNKYRTEDSWNNRVSNWNIWGCDLFDNPADARKSFG